MICLFTLKNIMSHVCKNHLFGLEEKKTASSQIVASVICILLKNGRNIVHSSLDLLPVLGMSSWHMTRLRSGL